MIFESPAILWALPLALLPTLIHLLGKRPRKPTPIPSLMWLNTFRTSERRRQKLRDLIVLAMRTLAILSVIFALGRPNFGVRVQELVIDNHPGLWQQGTWLEELLEKLPAGNYNITTRDGAHFENIAQSNIATLMAYQCEIVVIFQLTYLLDAFRTRLVIEKTAKGISRVGGISDHTARLENLHRLID